MPEATAKRRTAKGGFGWGVVVALVVWLATASAAWSNGGYGLGLADLMGNVLLFGALGAVIGAIGSARDSRRRVN